MALGPCGHSLILFVVSLTAILREREEQSESKAALADFQVINSVRDQITQNSLALSGYLLSGDSHEREAVNQGIGDLDDLFRNSTCAVLESSPH